MKDIILEIRSKNNLSQDDLSKRLFVTRQAVSRWECGEAEPNKEVLKLIAKEFGISASALLGLSEYKECQSCGMTFKEVDDFGTTQNGGIHTDYCTYCMQNGSFTNERTIDEMIEANLRFLDEYNKETDNSFTPEQARAELKQHLKTLKRWKD